MRCLILLRRARRASVVLTLACVAVTAVAVWRSSASGVDDKAAVKRQFHTRIRDGVGREVRLSRGGAPGQARAAVNSAAEFIRNRSGFRLSEAAKDRLTALEEDVRRGEGRRLDTAKLSDAISSTVLERLASLTDQDISYADDILRGFNAPDLPKNFARDLKLPGGMVFIGASPEKTTARLKAVRDQLNTPAGEVFAGMMRNKVLGRVRDRARSLAEAVPEQFGNLWDVADDRDSRAADGGFAPLQAFLVVYSLISDDYLDYSQANLARWMDSRRESLSKLTGRPYPAPDAHRAYGVNGYLFSAPLDLLLDERTLNGLLARLEKGGGA